MRKPGVTVILSPYAELDSLRDGLGVRVQYTLINHSTDKICSTGSCQGVPAQLDQARTVSSWGEDYVTVTAQYEFGTAKRIRSVAPRISFSWDIPAMLLLSKGAIKTHKISLGASFDF